jgi:hypothetical protein
MAPIETLMGSYPMANSGRGAPAMSDVEACKRELFSIVDGGSIDPGGDARQMTQHFCTVLSTSRLDRLQADLDKELTAWQRQVSSAHTIRHDRTIAVLAEALKVLMARRER